MIFILKSPGLTESAIIKEMGNCRSPEGPDRPAEVEAKIDYLSAICFMDPINPLMCETRALVTRALVLRRMESLDAQRQAALVRTLSDRQQQRLSTEGLNDDDNDDD